MVGVAFTVALSGGTLPAIARAGKAGAGVSPLPIRMLTPGATDSSVTQATIRTTICGPKVGGETWSMRARAQLKNAAAVKQYLLATTYHRRPGKPKDYELDHLIPLELGGNPTDTRNLWPEPWEKKGAHKDAFGYAKDGKGAQSKDAFEDDLTRRVCKLVKPMSLATARNKVKRNWHAAWVTAGCPGVKIKPPAC
jgi:hypothetical protein